MTIRTFCFLTVVVLFLSSCSPSTTGTATTPHVPSASPTSISELPAKEDPAAKPVPLGAAQLVESFGHKVLASQNGNFQAQLKPVGPNLDIALLKTASLDEPGFSTGATSGPRDFEGRIITDLQTHPEFKLPLVTVLEASDRPENVEALKLSPEHISIAKALLETVQSQTE